MNLLTKLNFAAQALFCPAEIRVLQYPVMYREWVAGGRTFDLQSRSDAAKGVPEYQWDIQIQYKR